MSDRYTVRIHRHEYGGLKGLAVTVDNNRLESISKISITIYSAQSLIKHMGLSETALDSMRASSPSPIKYYLQPLGRQIGLFEKTKVPKFIGLRRYIPCNVMAHKRQIPYAKMASHIWNNSPNDEQEFPYEPYRAIPDGKDVGHR
jgi:hypothetical protein